MRMIITLFIFTIFFFLKSKNISINIKIPKYEYSLIIDQKLFPIVKLVINKIKRNKKS